MKKLDNKVVLITGGTSGIGEATALLCAEHGAKVLLLGRNQEKGASIVKLIEDVGGKAKFFACDVGSLEEIHRVTEIIDREFAVVDVLINSAGIAPGGTIETLSYELWDEIFNVNVRGTFAFCKWVVPKMRAHGQGNIINVASTCGSVGANGLHGYSSSKGAVTLLTKSMAADYSKENIRVNCLSPGATLTPMMDELGAEGLQEFAKMIPAQRMANPEEIAKVALFLASDDSSFIFGANIMADGGFTAI